MMTDKTQGRTLAEAERDLAERLAESKRYEKIRDQRRQECWNRGEPWQRIEDCPFAAWADTYEEEGTILVTDHERLAQVSVRQREDGEWELADTHAGGAPITFTPTYWMPLPRGA